MPFGFRERKNSRQSSVSSFVRAAVCAWDFVSRCGSREVPFVNGTPRAASRADRISIASLCFTQKLRWTFTCARERQNLRVHRAFGGAATEPRARDFLGTRTFLGGEDDARGCAGAWGRDPGRVAHASATPIARRVPKASRMGWVRRNISDDPPRGARTRQ
jgi:hypothetical protein